MAISYRCVDGDRIDLIVLDTYGSLEMLPKVLASNVHLCDLPLILSAGTVLSLPDETVEQTIVTRKEGALW